MTAPILDIRVIGTPRPKGSLRPFVAANGKARAREQLPGSPDWRQDVITSAFRAIACCDDPECTGFRDGYPYTGPVTVTIALEFTPPKKRNEHPHTRPSGDADKHARNILDALQDAGVIKDDAAVVDLVVAKRYTEGAAGARIVVWPGASDFLGEPTPAGPRPSVHDPITKSYAIDQITDIEHLRKVAHRMWEAFLAAHAQAAHACGVLMRADCPVCVQALHGERDTGCEQWQEWQRKVSDGFGSV